MSDRPGRSLPGLPRAGRCVVMGVLNVTPDSFSDGGRWLDPDAAIQHGLAMARQGADIVDVGGESTRPGATRVDAAEEQRRVLPVVTALVAAGVPVSIDTMRAVTAETAISAGAVLVNDVSGGLADPDLPKLVAAAGVGYVVMHWRGHSERMQQQADYADVVTEVVDELAQRVDDVTAAGVHPERLVIDPGIGFAKQPVHNWTLLAHIEALHRLGLPLLVGASRKSFLGSLLASEGQPRSTDGRDAATVAITAHVAARGVWGVRVHDVAPNVDAVRVVAAIEDSGSE